MGILFTCDDDQDEEFIPDPNDTIEQSEKKWNEHLDRMRMKCHKQHVDAPPFHGR